MRIASDGDGGGPPILSGMIRALRPRHGRLRAAAGRPPAGHCLLCSLSMHKCSTCLRIQLRAHARRCPPWAGPGPPARRHKTTAARRPSARRWSLVQGPEACRQAAKKQRAAEEEGKRHQGGMLGCWRGGAAGSMVGRERRGRRRTRTRESRQPAAREGRARTRSAASKQCVRACYGRARR